MNGWTDIGADRWMAAAAVLIAYALLCMRIGWRVSRTRRAAEREAALLAMAAEGGAAWLVLHASQTGNAEHIARQTAQALHAAGQAVRVMPLDAWSCAIADVPSRALLVVSTYGEGDPPDEGAGFLPALESARPDLAGLHYGLLALGDASYRHFCGFGRSVDAALAARGAQRLFPAIEVDRGDDAAIDAWRHALAAHASTGDIAAWQAPAWQAWTLVSRSRLNPGSEAGPVWLVRLLPPPGQSVMWESGDLAQVLPPGEGEPPRDYSIASIAADGWLELVVRCVTRSDGTAGVASDWLCGRVAVGETVQLRLREHRAFRLGDNASRPLVLIGNGTGIAGLRGHLRARAAGAAPGRNWLVFGERRARHDFLLHDEIEAWRTDGTLERLDLAFSRDQAERVYVQDRLRAAEAPLREWVAAGCALYVCGSLQGMAGGVDDALRGMFGDAQVDALAMGGRYRRDVY
ncbi:sulfite reductase subunit alpha [Xylophilus sp. GOD-11R]|uniref:sulfite reductase subunit alpha n=1 Tax=Xylophilus sp. GOD-11R TaxID=3089814 RepID=UPI00298C5A97|nr:sulfite reductase subunit alpha [Xylophilus sp. GOD-11R]WPB56103.1 sulfite reductase subunit alpha [Xylophilus sp. GOD-11R]